jgi:hypothetical protein
MSQEDQGAKIYFPFIGVTCKTALINGKEGTIEAEDQHFTLRTREALQPFGDMDTLRYFKAEEPSKPKESPFPTKKSSSDKKEVKI